MRQGGRAPSRGKGATCKRYCSGSERQREDDDGGEDRGGEKKMIMMITTMTMRRPGGEGAKM